MARYSKSQLLRMIRYERHENERIREEMQKQRETMIEHFRDELRALRRKIVELTHPEYL